MSVEKEYSFIYNKFFFDYTVLYLRYIHSKKYKHNKMFSEKLNQFKTMVKYETVISCLTKLNTSWRESIYFYKYTFIEYISIYIQYIFNFYLYIEHKFPLPTFIVADNAITAFEYMLREGIKIEDLK